MDRNTIWNGGTNVRELLRAVLNIFMEHYMQLDVDYICLTIPQATTQILVIISFLLAVVSSLILLGLFVSTKKTSGNIFQSAHSLWIMSCSCYFNDLVVITGSFPF